MLLMLKQSLSLKKLIINFLIFNIIFLGNKDLYKKKNVISQR